MCHVSTGVVLRHPASSGIGRAAALAFAKEGMNVFMVDVDGEELSLAQRMVKSQAASSEQLIVAEVIDVSDEKMMQALAEQVYDATRKCHILFNNAGIGLGGGAVSTDIATVDKVLKVNLYGAIHGCLAFVPRMKASGHPGIIINTGSKQGITCPPGNVTYNVSKAALKVYTEGLEHELTLERLDGHGKLRAVLLVPGWVNTSILLKAERTKALAKGEKYDPAKAFFHEDKPHEGAWLPSQVIDFMREEIDKGRFYVICPDNEVDGETDKRRMLWAMQDVTENRPPLSRWHPEFKEAFTAYLHTSQGAS